MFADSSALVKLYADEPGFEVIRSIIEPMVVSHIARVEVPAAIWRKHRMGELTIEDARILVSAFEFDLHGDLAAFVPVAVTSAILDDAARLVATHGLRAYDGLQLASATAARQHVPGCRTFAAFDADLRRAAAVEGFGLAP